MVVDMERKRAIEGFAIRCPHCGNWDVHQKDPEKFIVTADSIEQIMNDFDIAIQNKKVDDFLGPEMFRCTQPRWACPVSFEAFIFNDNKIAQESLKKIRKKWAISRDFRLYKADRKNRWDKPGEENYFCIMFGTEPVRRQRDIELEHLLDPELASKMIRGIRYEINVPFTIYSANILEGKTKNEIPYWMPIEAYSIENPLVPSGYNIFCKTCRGIVTESIEKELKAQFNDKKIMPENCPFTTYWNQQSKKCAGRKPVCKNESIDWNHCPAFIDERIKVCFCYNSDKELIKQTIGNWKANTASISDPEKCPAGFKEYAFPITVHEHLIGVGMAGQMFTNREDIASVDEFLKVVKGRVPVGQNHPLKEKKEDLMHAQFGLFWHEKENRQKDIKMKTPIENKKARFIVLDKDLEYRIKLVQENIRKIEKVAEARYQDIRTRSENAFRDELMGFTQYTIAKNLGINKTSFFKGTGDKTPIIRILKRMREFWAFKMASFLRWDPKNNLAMLMAYSVAKKTNNQNGEAGKAFGFEGSDPRHFYYSNNEIQEHPIFWLRDPQDRHGQRYPKNELMSKICHLIEDINEIKKRLEPKGCYFVILVPFERNTYSFVFLNRDKENLSRTPAKRSLAVSQLCQEFMLRICTEMAYELCNVRFREKDIEQGNKQIEIKDNTTQSQSNTTMQQRQRDNNIDIIDAENT